MEIPGDTAQSLLREGQRQCRCGERLTLLQVIFRIVLIDTGKEVVVVGIVRDHLQAIVSRVADSRSYDVAHILLPFPVQREHYLAVVGVRIARAVLVHDDLLSWCQRFLHQSCLVSP